MSFDLSLVSATVSYGGIVDLSPSTVNLCVMALNRLVRRASWRNDGALLTDSEWDSLDADISLALDEIMGSLVGMIFPAIWSTASAFKFLPCDGGTYNKSDYPLLYDALDSQYILSGTQFTVPDLRDMFLAGSGGSYLHGDTGGSDEVQLTVGQLPAHDHTYYQYTFGVDIESVGVPDPTGVGQPSLSQNTGLTGGNEAHENRPPFFAVPFYIVAG